MGILDEIFAPADVPSLSTAARRSTAPVKGSPMDAPYVQAAPSAGKLFEARCLVERECARPSLPWLPRKSQLAPRPAVLSLSLPVECSEAELLAGLHALQAPSCVRPEAAAEAAVGAMGVLAALAAPSTRRRERDDSDSATTVIRDAHAALQVASGARVGLVSRGDLGRVDRALSAAMRAAATEQAARRALHERAVTAFGAVQRARHMIDHESGILQAKLATYGDLQE